MAKTPAQEAEELKLKIESEDDEEREDPSQVVRVTLASVREVAAQTIDKIKQIREKAENILSNTPLPPTPNPPVKTNER